MKKIVTLIIAIILLIVIVVNVPVVKIKSTERGIVSSRGAIQNFKLNEGLHFLMPFRDTVKKIAITPQTLEVDIPVGAQGSITKDNQTVGTDLTIFYRFKDSELINAAKNYGFDLLKEKVKKDVTEAFKQTIGQYSIYDVAGKQEEIRVKFIAAAVSKVGVYPLVIDDIKVSNYDWSTEFDAQIAKTMQIAQESKQQEQELKKVEFSTQQQVITAKANRDAEILNAEAMAAKGKGIQEYNQAITSNPKNMELEIRLKQLAIEQTLADKRDGVRVSEQNFTPIPITLNNK